MGGGVWRARPLTLRHGLVLYNVQVQHLREQGYMQEVRGQATGHPAKEQCSTCGRLALLKVWCQQLCESRRLLQVQGGEAARSTSARR